VREVRKLSHRHRVESLFGYSWVVSSRRPSPGRFSLGFPFLSENSKFGGKGRGGCWCGGWAGLPPLG
jgi:hypothetical protein